eukprot:gene12653-6553_t
MSKNEKVSHPDDTKKIVRTKRSVVCDPFDKEFSIENYAATVRFLDDPGSEEFDHVRSLTYQEGNLFLICFSMVDVKSLDHLEEKWIPLVKKNCPKGFYVFVGLKLDLYNDDEFMKEQKLSREKMREKIETFKNDHKGVPYFEVSAKERVNMDQTVAKSVELTIAHLKKKKMLQSFVK